MEVERREDAWSCNRSSKGRSDGSKLEIATRKLKVRKLQRTLYHQACKHRQWRAWSLYADLCRKELLAVALDRVLENGGAPGVDRLSVRQVKAQREAFLRQLQSELIQKRYRASPVRRVLIAKSNGGQRALGIPTVKDRVVQMAVVLLLGPIFEADFHEHSYGYRPGKNAHQALDAIVEALRSGYTEVIDADLSGYFDTIPHQALLGQVSRRVSDGSILALISQWLKAPIAPERGSGEALVANRRGCPQGGVISPLLANLYLNGLDHQVNASRQPQCRMVRYADDLVILCPPRQAAGVLLRLKRYLEAKGLTLNESKTRVVDLRCEGMEFLGFKLWKAQGLRTKRDYIHIEPSVKAQHKLRASLREELNRSTQWRTSNEVVGRVNAKLRGWCGYFHYGNSTQVFKRQQRFIEARLIGWLAGKHRRKAAKWKHYPRKELYPDYGLYRVPLKAAWKQARR